MWACHFRFSSTRRIWRPERRWRTGPSTSATLTRSSTRTSSSTRSSTICSTIWSSRWNAHSKRWDDAIRWPPRYRLTTNHRCQGVYTIKEHHMPNYVVPGLMKLNDKYINVQRVKTRLDSHIKTIVESSYMTEVCMFDNWCADFNFHRDCAIKRGSLRSKQSYRRGIFFSAYFIWVMQWGRWTRRHRLIKLLFMHSETVSIKIYANLWHDDGERAENHFRKHRNIDFPADDY